MSILGDKISNESGHTHVQIHWRFYHLPTSFAKINLILSPPPHFIFWQTKPLVVFHVYQTMENVFISQPNTGKHFLF